MSNVAGVRGKGAFTAAADVEKFQVREWTRGQPLRGQGLLAVARVRELLEVGSEAFGLGRLIWRC